MAIIVRISTATGAAARGLAERLSAPTKEMYYKSGDVVVSYSGYSYSMGLPGALGFCSPAARYAFTHRGVYMDHDGFQRSTLPDHIRKCAVMIEVE